MATVIFLTSGSSWAVPGDCPAIVDSVECIGGGFKGIDGSTPRTAIGGAGGGGGAYAKVLNLAVSGSVSYQIGIANSATSTADTWFKSTSDVQAIGAKSSLGALASSSTGSTTFNGGDGGAVLTTSAGGGGGAGGPSGAGVIGVSGASTSNGGAGDNGSGGAGGSGGTPPTAGSAGTEYDATHGSGGGGGGRRTSVGTGAAGGNYGAGGGGGTGAGNAGGSGAGGLIVITYTPTGGGTVKQRQTLVGQAITRASYW